MNKLIPATLALAAVLAFSPAFADEHAKPADAAVAVESTAATDAAVAPATEATTMNYVLADGTTNVVVENGKVFIVAADGTKTVAPDGDHATTTEGVTLKVKDGMLVSDMKTDAGAEHKE
jgi:hypothetical protein